LASIDVSRFSLNTLRSTSVLFVVSRLMTPAAPVPNDPFEKETYAFEPSGEKTIWSVVAKFWPANPEGKGPKVERERVLEVSITANVYA
jgi:hypothetical protein